MSEKKEKQKRRVARLKREGLASGLTAAQAEALANAAEMARATSIRARRLMRRQPRAEAA